jgi:hypothetical protein
MLLMALMTVVSTCALGGIVDIAGPQVDTLMYTFGQAEVTSTVYELGNLYLYTYVIDNPEESTQNVSWFSVETDEDADVQSVGYDIGANAPAIWHEIVSSMNSTILSVDALFINAIEAGEESTVLFFISSKAPTTTTGYVGGKSVIVEGDVLSPVPEPATMLILAAGALVTLRRRS